MRSFVSIGIALFVSMSLVSLISLHFFHNLETGMFGRIFELIDYLFIFMFGFSLVGMWLIPFIDKELNPEFYGGTKIETD